VYGSRLKSAKVLVLDVLLVGVFAYV